MTPVGKEDTIVMDTTVKTYNEQQTAEIKAPGDRRRGGR